ncbi:MAG TPA: hypothetical protein ENI85_15335 [Deltaproteobacteria bacterium]|nr:hypothetical protein [Deltaproteobacteria bacterium]
MALFLIARLALAGAPGPVDDSSLLPRDATATKASDASKRTDTGEEERRERVPIPIPADLLPASPSRHSAARAPTVSTPMPPDPSARLLEGSEASEYWTLYIELDSGHRITQRFLLSNAGPGDHNAVAVGHLIEPGRKPYRYENGRRRSRWTLSEDRLFFDIAASHLDLHRPTGELRITKDDIEIRLFFAFPATGLAASMPRDRLPDDYHVDVLAVAAATHGTLLAPWMEEPLPTTGRTWLAHTWTRKREAALLDRRVEIYANDHGTSFYGIHLRRRGRFERGWALGRSEAPPIIESRINVPASWIELDVTGSTGSSGPYPLPTGFELPGAVPWPRRITLGQEWLRFDPLAVIPQPFRWFIRRSTQPREVWANARIDGTLSPAPGTPSLPDSGEAESEIERDSNSKRETEVETAERSVTGVASITFFNPTDRR